MEKNYLNKLHNSTKRDYLARMQNQKVSCMIEAKKYEKNYWDGDRKYGYGGYSYLPNRWTPFAKKLINDYKLKNQSKILEIGCGKGYLLKELNDLNPNFLLQGFDISKHAIKNSHSQIKDYVSRKDARSEVNFNKKFDLVIALGVLHNFFIDEIIDVLMKIQKISNGKAYILVESYRNEKELFNLQCWALTCNSFFTPKEWEYIFKIAKYTGDYEFIYFK